MRIGTDDGVTPQRLSWLYEDLHGNHIHSSCVRKQYEAEPPKCLSSTKSQSNHFTAVLFVASALNIPPTTPTGEQTLTNYDYKTTRHSNKLAWYLAVIFENEKSNMNLISILFDCWCWMGFGFCQVIVSRNFNGAFRQYSNSLTSSTCIFVQPYSRQRGTCWFLAWTCWKLSRLSFSTCDFTRKVCHWKHFLS